MTAVNEAILAIVRLKEDVGDVSSLRSLVVGPPTLAGALATTYAATPPAGEFVELRDRVDLLARESEDLGEEFNENILETSRNSLRRIKACIDRIAEVETYVAGMETRLGQGVVPRTTLTRALCRPGAGPLSRSLSMLCFWTRAGPRS